MVYLAIESAEHTTSELGDRVMSYIPIGTIKSEKGMDQLIEIRRLDSDHNPRKRIAIRIVRSCIERA